MPLGFLSLENLTGVDPNVFRLEMLKYSTQVVLVIGAFLNALTDRNLPFENESFKMFISTRGFKAKSRLSILLDACKADLIHSM